MTGVGLLVGGWFASPVIKTVFEKAQKYLEANWGLLTNAEEMVKDLTRTLSVCGTAMIVFQEKEIINNDALAEWLKILKKTVYDAEDVLDNMEAKSIKKKVQGKNKVREFTSSSLCTAWNLIVPDDILESLNKVLVQLNKLSADIPAIVALVKKIENNESHPRGVINPTETMSEPFEKVDLYGRQSELDLILESILCSESESSKEDGHVIPIIGMGGVGKTALAKAVFNYHTVQKTFPTKAWISVSNKRDVDVKWVLIKIYQSLGETIPDSITLDIIITRITLCIGGVGKFLIVLDDMIEMIEDDWAIIEKTLSYCAPGSVVLITTQYQEFAYRVRTFGPIALSALDSGNFWKLFKCFAFGDKVMSENKRIRLESIGKKIAAKLGGLPLAAKIIGNKLGSNLDEGTWIDILEREWWDIPEGKSQILPSIGVGYEQLDPCLRQCFAYCSIFPRNSLIEKDRLVHMWIAQNFIQSNVGGWKKLEDIGREWFDELVEKFFFQHKGDDNSYVMHDLMHDLAVIVSSGDCFYLGEGSDGIPPGVWHLAVDTHHLDVIKGIPVHNNLRSFLYFKRGPVEGMYRVINNTLSTLDSIRVLDLSGMCMEKEKKPPTNIWKLQHLRFLDLSSTGIEHLTSSIGLYHLQALYVQKCEFLQLPRGIDKFINLRRFC